MLLIIVHSQNSNEMPSLPPHCADNNQEGSAEGLTTFEEMVHTISTGGVSFTYPYLEIRKSLIPGARFGVFTTKFIKEGGVVEVCPSIYLNPAQYPEGEDINDYIFHGAADDSKRYIIAADTSQYWDPTFHFRSQQVSQFNSTKLMSFFLLLFLPRFVSLGYGSMYNHHDDPNMHWRILNTKHGGQRATPLSLLMLRRSIPCSKS